MVLSCNETGLLVVSVLGLVMFVVVWCESLTEFGKVNDVGEELKYSLMGVGELDVLFRGEGVGLKCGLWSCFRSKFGLLFTASLS